MNGVVSRVLVINRKLDSTEKANALAWVGAGMLRCAVIGDSTVSHLASNQGMPQAMKISAFVGGMIVNAGDVADAGDRIADQLALWTALPNKTALQAVFVQIGLNDVKGRVGESLATTAQVIADYQNLINTINADKPVGCKVYVSQMTPCRTWLNLATNPAAAYAAWQDLNTAIAGGGATPITGVDGRITSHVAALAGASDILHANYNMDDVHENNEARFIISQAWRTQLEGDGLL
jgi:lysophospholipase L1-like esterase